MFDFEPDFLFQLANFLKPPCRLQRCELARDQVREHPNDSVPGIPGHILPLPAVHCNFHVGNTWEHRVPQNPFIIIYQAQGTWLNRLNVHNYLF
jgi:hypothetical protein